MERREILRYLASSAALAALPLKAESVRPLVVWFGQSDEKALENYIKAFREGMRERGYAEGQNVNIETYSARFSKERAEQLAAEIVARKPAVIVTQGGVIRAVSRMTKTIPIVCGFSGDMVEAGLVASLARPGGNVTGMQFLAFELVGKRIELLKEAIPRLKHIAVISDISHPGEKRERDASRAAADKLGIRMDHYPVTSPEELEQALKMVAASGAKALVFFPDAVSFSRRDRIAAFALEHRMPTVSGWDAYADAGFLLVYGPSLRRVWRHMTYFVDRILKGAKPADLPAEMPNEMETVVNLKTAKVLGVKIPQSILLRADRVIE